MKTKFIIFIAALLLAVVSMPAQETAKKNMLHVKAGCNYSNVYGDSHWTHYGSGKFGFVGGLEYEFARGHWGMSLGALFSMQGQKGGLYDSGYNVFALPVTLNYHFSGVPLSLKAGIQYGRGDHTTDWSVPVGVSYRWRRFTVDATYKIGFYTTRAFVEAVPYPGYVAPERSRPHSGVLSLTVGYNFFSW